MCVWWGRPLGRERARLPARTCEATCLLERMYHSSGSSMETRHLLTATTSSGSPQPRSDSAILVGDNHHQHPPHLHQRVSPMPSLVSGADKQTPTVPIYYERNRFLRPRMGSRRVRNRLVQKYGFVNISLVNVPKQHRKYFR